MFENGRQSASYQPRLLSPIGNLSCSKPRLCFLMFSYKNNKHFVCCSIAIAKLFQLRYDSTTNEEVSSVGVLCKLRMAFPSAPFSILRSCPLPTSHQFTIDQTLLPAALNALLHDSFLNHLRTIDWLSSDAAISLSLSVVHIIDDGVEAAKSTVTTVRFANNRVKSSFKSAMTTLRIDATDGRAANTSPQRIRP